MPSFNTGHEEQTEAYLILCWGSGDKRSPGGMQGNAIHSILPENKTACYSNISKVDSQHCLNAQEAECRDKIISKSKRHCVKMYKTHFS